MSETKDHNNDYDSEPVIFCSRCYSLKIKHDDGMDSDYCADCGCFDVQEAPLEEWEKLYEKRYRHKFTQKNEDPKKTFIFNLTTEELKTKVYKSDKWNYIIHNIYPKFPGGLGKADSIILFFHHLIKDNKLNDLKFLLLKLFKY